jgi:hypothetical protein
MCDQYQRFTRAVSHHCCALVFFSEERNFGGSLCSFITLFEHGNAMCFSASQAHYLAHVTSILIAHALGFAAGHRVTHRKTCCSRGDYVGA